MAYSKLRSLHEFGFRHTQVKLSLVAEVVDTGRNPLASHASANYPNTAKPPERPTTQHRRRSRPKRW